MLPRIIVVLWVLSSVLALPLSSRAQDTASCSDFDAWIWAQSVYDLNPAVFSGLDPDGNEVACEELPIRAFGPALWADAIPDGAEPAQVTGITDGDTFDVIVNGVPDTIRMYHIDTPEISFEQHCGGPEATDFLAFVLQWAPNGTVYLEYDVTQRDDFDRRLAYVWYELAGDVYLVNEVMVRGGWAESETFRPDDKYKAELDEAEQFSVRHVLGVRLQCGRFGQEPGSTPSNQQLREAMQRQPNQGQFAGIGTSSGGDGGSGTEQQPADPPASNPDPAPEPTVAPPPPQPSGNCDPSYPGVCIPPRSQTGDLDCGDIGFRRFTVVPPDPHNFDGDFDGVGCESG